MNNTSPTIDVNYRSIWEKFLIEGFIALGWALLLGLPLFIVHMMLFDFEHDQHMGNNYSFLQSLTETIPHHPVSLALWILAIFIAVFAIRHAFQQKIQLIRAQEELTISYTQALTDGLTGVWNRLGFEVLFEKTLTRAKVQQQPFSIILGDVDGLKEYNDSYGHPAADIALRHITDVMKAQVRSSDAIARFGGDEFAVFSFNLNRDGAECLKERLMEALQNAPLTMSFGIATFPDDGDIPKALLDAADQRLYQSKAERKSVIHSNPHYADCQCDDCKCGKEDPSIEPLANTLRSIVLHKTLKPPA